MEYYSSFWSWYGMWAWMGPITRASVLLIGFLLLCAIYVFLKHIARQHAAVTAAASTLEFLRQQSPLGEFIPAVQVLKDGLTSSIVLAGLEAFQSAPKTMSDLQAVELAEHAMERREALAHLHARRGLIVLDTVAGVTPLVGLFAAMFAILDTFRGTAESVTDYLAFVVNSLAHAMVPAAFGLAVAAVAALFHSYISGRIDELDVMNAALIQRVRDYLRTEPRTPGSEDLFPTAEASDTKMPHYGNRVALCAIWLWWLYFVRLVVLARFDALRFYGAG